MLVIISPFARTTFAPVVFILLLVIAVMVESKRVWAQDSSGEDDQEAHVWLDKMSRAFKEKNYRGRFVYLSNDQVNSLEIFHKVKDGKEFERLVRLSGQRGEVVRRGHKLLCVHPGEHLARLVESIPSGPLAAKFRDRKKAFKNAYHLSLSGNSIVAGRPSQQVRVWPKDQLRYGYELWLDQDSALLLKSVLYDLHGKALEVFEFVDLHLDAEIDDRVFEVEGDVKVHHAGHVVLDPDHQPPESVKGWQVAWMPEGFTLAGRRDTKHHKLAQSPMDVLMYTDGLAAYSVFVEHADSDDLDTPMIRQEGATNAYSRGVISQIDNYWVTVVGELPLSTIKKIALSVVKSE